MGFASKFYTVSDAGFFPGTVALLNSLRLTGHLDDLVVLDNGLTVDQRRRLEAHAEVLDPPVEVLTNPYLLKPYPYVVGATGIVAIIDSDMIVTSSLAWLLERAERGQICMISEEDGSQDRWFPEWEADFGLNARLRRAPYANAGFLAASIEHWPLLFARWSEVCLRIPPQHLFSNHDHPMRYGDSDAINALLMSEFPASATFLVPEWQEIYASDSLECVAVIDEQRLVCVNDGRPILILHHDQRPKVWERSGRSRMVPNDAYVRLLPRVLFADDVPLRLERDEVAWWVRGRFWCRPAVRAVNTISRARAQASKVKARLRST